MLAAQEGFGSCITYRHNGDDGLIVLACKAFWVIKRTRTFAAGVTIFNTRLICCPSTGSWALASPLRMQTLTRKKTLRCHLSTFSFVIQTVMLTYAEVIENHVARIGCSSYKRDQTIYIFLHRVETVAKVTQTRNDVAVV